MLVAAQAVANNANLLFGRILLPRPPADVADKPFGWRGGGSGFLLVAAIRELLDRGFGKPRQGFEIKPPPTIDPIQQLLDEIDERSGS
jgi:hypothetical protein